MSLLRKSKTFKRLCAAILAAVLLILAMGSIVHADSIFKDLQKYANDTGAKEKASTAVSPFMGIIFFFIFILCSVITAIAIVFVLFKAWHVNRGKDSIDKAWVVKIVFVFVICALFGSASGLQILDVLKSTGMDNATKIIQQAGDTSSTSLPVVTPTPTQKK